MLFEARHALDGLYARELAKLSRFGVAGGDEDGVGNDVDRAEHRDFAGCKRGFDAGLRGRDLSTGSAAAGLTDLGPRADSFGGGGRVKNDGPMIQPLGECERECDCYYAKDASYLHAVSDAPRVGVVSSVT